jgi:hypothetical protein
MYVIGPVTSELGIASADEALRIEIRQFAKRIGVGIDGSGIRATFMGWEL